MPDTETLGAARVTTPGFPQPMYTHIQLDARDWDRQVRFYDAADFYAAYCRDPEGNKLAFVCAAREA